MNKLYQILNFQYQDVKMCDTLDEAKSYIESLKEIYDGPYYVIELSIVYSL